MKRMALAGFLVASGLSFGRTAETNGPPLPPAPPSPPPRRTKPPLQAVPAMARTSSAPASSRSPALHPSPPPAAPTTPVARLPAPGMTATTTTVRRVLDPFPLVFAEDAREVAVEPGATNALLRFAFTNASGKDVTLRRLQTSCRCTTSKMPALPWVLPAGTNSEFEISMDLRGKRGRITRMLYVYTDRSFKALTMRVIVPSADPTLMGERLRNMQAAAADRQMVFRGNCAVCHSHPGRGKLGRELFQAVCAVCHEAQQRAALVPDLRTLRHPTDAGYWRQWIEHGKAYTLMPAFAENQGGPLSPEQVDSLVGHLLERIPAGATTHIPGALQANGTNAGPAQATAIQ